MSNIVVGVDIGGTKTAVLVQSSTGQMLAQTSQPTDVTALLDSVCAAVESALQQAGTARAQIAAVGVGVPGMVEVTTGRVLLATNLFIHEPLALGPHLSAVFGCPITVENDVRLAALGVQQQLGLRDLVYLSLGTGVAAGVILNGQLWRGSHGMAGEIGHVPLALDTSEIIVLEQAIAGPAIVAAATAAGLRAEHAGAVFALAAAGDKAAHQIVSRTSQLTAHAIEWLVLSYDVERVILGGGVTHSGEWFLRPLQAALAERRAQSPLAARLLPDEVVELLPSTFNAGTAGAVMLARRALAPEIGR